MKKIAVICNYALKSDRIGGMDHFFHEYNDYMTSQGHKLVWFFSKVELFGKYKEFNLIEAENGNVENEFIKYTKESLDLFDLIITHFTELCTPFYKKCRQIAPNAKIVAVDHNPRPIEGYRLKKYLNKKIKGMLYSQYIDKFIAVSLYSKKHLLLDFGGFIKNKIEVVYNGIDINSFNIKTSYTKRNKFIVACHLRKEKGVQYLIEALLGLENLDFKVDIYGEGPYSDELKNEVKLKKLENIVSFKGTVNNLNSLYSSYDYLIHPSLGETYCYSVVESLISKLPVITTTNSGNVLGLIEDKKNGFLFEERNSEQLNEIIKNILKSEYKIDQKTFETVLLPDLSLMNMVYNYEKL